MREDESPEFFRFINSCDFLHRATYAGYDHLYLYYFKPEIPEVSCNKIHPYVTYTIAHAPWVHKTAFNIFWQITKRSPDQHIDYIDPEIQRVHRNVLVKDHLNIIDFFSRIFTEKDIPSYVVTTMLTFMLKDKLNY